MPIATGPSLKNKRMLFVVLFLSLLCAAIVAGFANQISAHIAGSANIAGSPARHPRSGAVLVRSEREGGKAEPPDAHLRTGMSALPAVPQTSVQFDLSRNVIAGGGGTSSAANFKVEGTIGQTAAGTQMSNG